MLPQCRRPISFARKMSGCWGTTTSPSHLVIVSALGVSLLVGCSLHASVNVFSGEVSRLVVTAVAVMSFKFWMLAVYAPDDPRKRRFIFKWLELFLVCSERPVLVEYWNSILDFKLDKVERVLVGRTGMKAVWLILWPSSIWSTDFTQWWRYRRDLN